MIKELYDKDNTKVKLAVLKDGYNYIPCDLISNELLNLKYNSEEEAWNYIDSNYSEKPIYYQMSSNNKSFLNMVHYLDNELGIKNNKFHMVLLDKTLIDVDPYDDSLSLDTKRRIYRECVSNYWYFLREVARVPESYGEGYYNELTYKSLQSNYLMVQNIDALISDCDPLIIPYRLAWIYVFGRASTIINSTNFENSKAKLTIIKDIIKMLPSYIGNNIRNVYSEDYIKSKVNRNIINTTHEVASIETANALGRGMTFPILWFDRADQTKYINELLVSSYPSFLEAKCIQKKSNREYGRIITTTNGNLVKRAIKFNNTIFDKSHKQLYDWLYIDNTSDIVYIE